jgi:hypothetical protein
MQCRQLALHLYESINPPEKGSGISIIISPPGIQICIKYKYITGYLLEKVILPYKIGIKLSILIYRLVGSSVLFKDRISKRGNEPCLVFNLSASNR